MPPIHRDVRLALRLLRRNPTSTAIAVLSIALSVGAISVVFGPVKAVLIDTLPYHRAAELVQIRTEHPKMAEQSRGDWVMWNDAERLRERSARLFRSASTATQCSPSPAARIHFPKLSTASSSRRMCSPRSA